MKRIAPLFLLLIFAGAVNAQTSKPSGSSLANAEQLLLDVAKTYQDAPALTDDIVVEITQPGGSMSMTLNMALGGKKDGFFAYDDWKFYAFNDTLFITRDAFPGKYIRHDLDDSFIQTIISNVGKLKPLAFQNRSILSRFRASVLGRSNESMPRTCTD